MPNQNKIIKGWVRLVLLILPYLFIVGIFQLIGLLLADVDFRAKHPETTVYQSLIVSLFNLTSTFLVLLFFIKIVDRENLIEIGFRLKDRIKDIIIGILLGLMIMGSALVLLIYFDQIVYDRVLVDFKSLLYMFFFYIVISVKEELLFRGYILRNLMYSFSKPVALVSSSFLFSMMHGLNPNFDFQAFINLFLAGILLGISYTYTKNLWFPIALHFSWNFFQSLFGFKVSGLDSYSLIEFKIIEPNLINGGEFGFEGSILSIIVQVILIVCIYIYYNRKAKKKELFEE